MQRELRRFQRVAVDLPITFSTPQKVCRGRTRNLSLSSMLMAVNEGHIDVLTPFDTGECELHLDGSTLTLPAQVMRRVGHDLALKFINLDKDMAQRLENHIHAALNASGKGNSEQRG